MKEKFVALGMVLILVFGFAACGHKDDEKREQKDDLVYVSEYITLPSPSGKEGMGFGIDILKLEDGILYYRNYGWNGENNYENMLYSFDLRESGAEPEKLPVNFSADRYPMKIAVGRDGCIYIAVTDSVLEGPGMETTEGYIIPRTTYKLLKYQPDGTMVYETDLSEKVGSGGNFYIQYMEADQDGNVYITKGEEAVWVFGTEGAFLFDVSLSQWVSGMGTSNTGEVYIAQYNSQGRIELRKVDFETRALSSPLSGLPQNLSGNVFSKGIKKNLLFFGTQEVYEYDVEDQSCEAVLNFIDVDLSPDNIRYMTAMEDGRIFVYMQDWDNSQRELVMLSKKPVLDVGMKEMLTLSCISLNSEVQKAIVNFNKSNDKYRITVKDYSQNTGGTERGWEDAITNMNNDFLAGNTGDLIVLNQMNIDQLAVKGVLEDLNPYLDGSSVLKREELIESVLTAYTAGGILTSIPTNFHIQTLVSASSLVGDKRGWNLDEMMAAAEKVPEDGSIFERTSKSKMLRTAVLMNQDEFIDWNTGECKFTGEEFIKLLEFCNTFPENEPEGRVGPYMPELVRSGKLLLTEQYLRGVADHQLIMEIWREPVTYVGYPSTTTNGSVIVGENAVGISTKSVYKEGAWAFIESLVSESDKNTNAWGFSIVKSGLEKAFEESMKADYILDFNGEKSLDEKGEPKQYAKSGFQWGTGEIFDIYAATQEDVDTVRDIIEHTTARYNYDNKLVTIIMEEAEPFFAGQKNVKEVADIIQNRIQIYVNESR